MPVDSVNLTASARTNLAVQQSLASEAAKRSQNLSSGKRVNAATDDAVAFAAAKALTDRSGDLAAVKDSVGQGVSTVNAALAGADGVSALLGQLKGIASAAIGTDNAAEKAGYAQQYNTVLGQIDSLAADSGYNGVNLLSSSSSSLTVAFSRNADDNLTVAPRDVSASGFGLSAAAADGSTFSATTLAQLDAATASNNSIQSSLGSNISALSIRAEATQSQANIATAGAASLTEADLNQEAASLVAIRTRQALARGGQGISNQAQTSLLKLF